MTLLLTVGAWRRGRTVRARITREGFTEGAELEKSLRNLGKWKRRHPRQGDCTSRGQKRGQGRCITGNCLQLRLREVEVIYSVDGAGVSLRFFELRSPPWEIYCSLFIK